MLFQMRHRYRRPLAEKLAQQYLVVVNQSASIEHRLQPEVWIHGEHALEPVAPLLGGRRCGLTRRRRRLFSRRLCRIGRCGESNRHATNVGAPTEMLTDALAHTAGGGTQSHLREPFEEISP